MPIPRDAATAPTWGCLPPADHVSGTAARVAGLLAVRSLEFPAPSGSSGASQQDGNPIKTSGLHRTPLSGGVQNATLRCDLPSPAVAGRQGAHGGQPPGMPRAARRAAQPQKRLLQLSSGLFVAAPPVLPPGPCPAASVVHAPRPAATAPPAVRNLVEQAQFAHLCTVMSNMHHRRAGYPFGSLVDFAADGAGHPIFRCTAAARVPCLPWRSACRNMHASWAPALGTSFFRPPSSRLSPG